MRAINFRDAYEFDPESYAEGGGLPGLLRQAMPQQSAQQQGVDFGSAPSNSPEYNAGELYQPKTEAGRYAETVGEMVPALFGGEALAAVRGVAKAGTVLRQLPATLLKHAVVPGIGVHAVQEAYPESNAGQVLQKGYPVVRRGLPLALAIQRYLGRRGLLETLFNLAASRV